METKPGYYFKKIKEFPVAGLFSVSNVLEIFKKRDEFLSQIKKPKIEGWIDETSHWNGNIVVGKDTRIFHSVIEGPVWIGENCRIGPNAHIRKGTIIGNNCEIGKIEIKGSILMNNVKAHHHGYIGDSILGDSVNVGAGVVTTNLKLSGEAIGKTGMKKIGAIIGDNVHLGSNVTTTPGTFIGPETWIYPNVILRGFVPENKIVKHKPVYEIVEKK
jgi:NDP-sugar pyrophosphorylase family protein